MAGCALAAVPGVAAQRGTEIGAPRDDGATHPPTSAVAEKKFRALALFRRELVRHHQLDGRPRQDALAAVQPPVQHHAAEGKIVVEVETRPEPPAAKDGGSLQRLLRASSKKVSSFFCGSIM